MSYQCQCVIYLVCGQENNQLQYFFASQTGNRKHRIGCCIWQRSRCGYCRLVHYMGNIRARYYGRVCSSNSVIISCFCSCGFLGNEPRSFSQIEIWWRFGSSRSLIADSKRTNLIKEEVEHPHHLDIDIVKRYGTIRTTVTTLSNNNLANYNNLKIVYHRICYR